MRTVKSFHDTKEVSLNDYYRLGTKSSELIKEANI